MSVEAAADLLSAVLHRVGACRFVHVGSSTGSAVHPPAAVHTEAD